MQEQEYYFITVFEQFGVDKLGWPDTGCRRCWGFYCDKDTAIQALHENWTDMNETIYDYAVIEEYYEGIGQTTFNHWFFKYNQKLDEYQQINQPEELRHYAGFALG